MGPAASLPSALALAVAAVVIVVLAVVALRLARSRRSRAARAFAEALEVAPDAMVVVDADGRISHANQHVRDLFGYPPAELIGQNVDILVPDRLVGSHQRHRARYTEAPGARPMGAGLDLRGRRKDGSEVPIDVSLSPVHSDEGPRFVAAVRDVSERHAAEANRALMAAIVASSQDAIYGVDLDGNIRSWNQAAERLYGYKAEEIIGRSIELLVPPTRQGEAMALLDRMRRGEEVQRHRTTRRRTDGAVVDVALSFSPLVEGGEISGVAIVARDITAEKAAEEAMAAAFERERHAAEQLRRSDQVKDDFLDATSHELRTPLAAITGFVELLREGAVAPELTDDLLGRIHHNALQMRAMVDRLLDFSRLRAGKVHVAMRPVLLADAVRRAVAITPVAADHRIDVGVPADLAVLADVDGLDHVLTNLLDNAARFSPAGSRITIVAREQGDRAEITVADHGIGIAPADLPLVFERFYRGDVRPGEERGVGIGLAIVRNYVELQGGEVRVESNPGSGTRVTFTLRRTASEAAADAVAEEPS